MSKLERRANIARFILGSQPSAPYVNPEATAYEEECKARNERIEAAIREARAQAEHGREAAKALGLTAAEYRARFPNIVGKP